MRGHMWTDPLSDRIRRASIHRLQQRFDEARNRPCGAVTWFMTTGFRFQPLEWKIREKKPLAPAEAPIATLRFCTRDMATTRPQLQLYMGDLLRRYSRPNTCTCLQFDHLPSPSSIFFSLASCVSSSSYFTRQRSVLGTTFLVLGMWAGLHSQFNCPLSK